MNKIFKGLRVSAMIMLCVGGWYLSAIFFMIGLDVVSDIYIIGMTMCIAATAIAIVLPVVVYKEIISILK